jgi:hypothetical protein
MGAGAGGGIVGLLVVLAIVFLPQLLGSDGTTSVDPALDDATGPTKCETEIEQVVCGAVDDVSIYWEAQYPVSFQGAFPGTDTVFFSGARDRPGSGRTRLLQEGVAGQAEDALADLVALDLRRAAGDRHPAVHQHEQVAQRARAVHEQRVGAVELGHDRRGLVADLGQHQLGHRALRAGLAAGDGTVRAAQVEQPHRLVLGDVATDPRRAAVEAFGVASNGATSAAPGIDMPPVPPPMLTLSLPSVARATVQPPSTGPTTSSSGTNTSLKNTSLNSEAPTSSSAAGPRRPRRACRSPSS